MNILEKCAGPAVSMALAAVLATGGPAVGAEFLGDVRTDLEVVAGEGGTVDDAFLQRARLAWPGSIEDVQEEFCASLVNYFADRLLELRRMERYYQIDKLYQAAADDARRKKQCEGLAPRSVDSILLRTAAERGLLKLVASRQPEKAILGAADKKASMKAAKNAPCPRPAAGAPAPAAPSARSGGGLSQELQEYLLLECAQNLGSGRCPELRRRVGAQGLEAMAACQAWGVLNCLSLKGDKTCDALGASCK